MMVGLIASPDVILCTRSNLQSWHARSWMTEGDFIADLLPRPPTSEYTAESMYKVISTLTCCLMHQGAWPLRYEELCLLVPFLLLQGTD